MKRHEKTWREFLTKMTILGKDENSLINHTSQDYLQKNVWPVAEALALAAPQGPQGFPCQDGCCMPDAEMLNSLTRAITEAIYVYSNLGFNELHSVIIEIQKALKTDLRNESAQKYVAQWPDNFAAYLAQWKVMVSPQSTAVIQARTIFPNTWAVIEEKTK